MDAGRPGKSPGRHLVSAMRIVQTIAGTRVDHGGTSRSVPALCDSLVEMGIDNHLLTARPADPSIRCNYPKELSRVHVVDESAIWRQFQIGKKFCRELDRLIVDPERTLVHDHAVWLASNHAVAQYCRAKKIRRIVSPRGMLGRWALDHGRWKKRLAWKLYQRADLASAVGFHATSQQEADEILALGFQQPIAVVPNGVDFPDRLPDRKNRTGLQALFLSRIHPKKGLLNLVRAWKLATVPNGWRLVIAGPDENGHQREVQALVAELGLSGQVDFPGAVDDKDKWQMYVDSDLFVLPSFNENFGIVIAEAMAAGLPVITTQGTPWSCLPSNQMGWWVEASIDAIQAAITEATSLSDDARLSMGAAANRYVHQNFDWRSTARHLAEFYQQLATR